MRFRVAFTDPDQHTFSDELLSELHQLDAEFDARRCPTEGDTITLCRDADAVMMSATRICRPVIEELRRCRIIARIGTGYDNVDVRAAADHGIPVTNVPNFCTEEVANHTLAMLLAVNRSLIALDQQVKAGVWEPNNILPARRLCEQTIGLVGFGAIGRAVAARCLAFGLRVLYYDPITAITPDSSIQKCDSLSQLLREADYVSLHVPATEQTKHFFGRPEFAQMKRSAVIINTARGNVIDEAALVHALSDGIVAGAALDVLNPEPPRPDNPLLKYPQVIFSPHCASHSVESLSEVKRRALAEVCRALQGLPLEHVVNLPLKPRSRVSSS